MSRSYKKPVAKLKNDTYFKKLFNKRTRKNKTILSDGNEYKKLNCSYEICDYKDKKNLSQKNNNYKLTIK